MTSDILTEEIDSATQPLKHTLNKEPDIFHPSITFLMWKNSLLISLLLFSFFTAYVYIQNQTYSLLQFSQAIAGTAAVMIGTSFAFSGFCYYFDFVDTKIAYRKYFGLIGYYFAVIYSILLLFIEPEKYWHGLSSNLLTADVILGLTAMLILTFMAIISNKKIMLAMGVNKWRNALRTGYVAIFLLIVRATILESNIWLEWFNKIDSLPPIRFLISIYAVFVILLRFSIIGVTHFKRQIQ